MDSVLCTEMWDKETEEKCPLWYKGMSWFGVIRTHHGHQSWSLPDLVRPPRNGGLHYPVPSDIDKSLNELLLIRYVTIVLITITVHLTLFLSCLVK